MNGQSSILSGVSRAQRVDTLGEKRYSCLMEKSNITEGITFDDVLLVPRFSDLTPDLVDTSTRLT